MDFSFLARERSSVAGEGMATPGFFTSCGFPSFAAQGARVLLCILRCFLLFLSKEDEEPAPLPPFGGVGPVTFRPGGSNPPRGTFSFLLLSRTRRRSYFVPSDDPFSVSAKPLLLIS